MTRQTPPSPSGKGARAQTRQQGSDETQQHHIAGQQAAASRHTSKTKTAATASGRDTDFTVHIIGAAEAGPLLNETQRLYLRPDSLVFFLCREQQASNIAVFGFCIVHNKGGQKPAINTGAAAAIIARTGGETAARPVPMLRFAAENIVKTHQGKNFLEIALFHIADKRKTPRAKTLLLRAVADYCQKKQIDYIFGQFSFAGKYPAAYAREFSYLYHHYQVKKSFTPACDSAKSVSMDIMPAEAVPPGKNRHFMPPLLRYCLRLGAKAGDRVAVDKSYNQGAGAMNVFLLMPLSRPAEINNLTGKAGKAEATAILNAETVPKA